MSTLPFANHPATVVGRDAAKTISTSTQGSTLADVLERVLDKGIVIAGDISVSVATTELLTIRIRLLISSVDKAREIGINWWENNPHYSSQTRDLLETNRQLMERVNSLESEVRSLRLTAAQPTPPAAALNEETIDLLLEGLSTNF